MKLKELKNLAKKIAKEELVLKHSQDSETIKRAENEIMKLCGHVNSIEDMVLIDDLVQDILANS